jgi:ectoine hydroxylase-related dioxygenase (phytanoyl-CoA dioxygenase family)
MDELSRYLFDLQGFVVLRNVLPQPLVRRLELSLDALDAAEARGELPAHVAASKPRSAEELYLSNIVEAGPEFEALIDVSPVIDVIREVSLGLFRLNHTYSIHHFKNAMTPLHMAGTPIHPKAHYEARNGQIFSTLTKAVFPIANHAVEDGCFAAVPGSHKASFVRPRIVDGAEPGLSPVDAAPGDAIVFTEAMTHGSLRNVSGRCRKTLYYCYSVGYMPDWTKLGLTFSAALLARLTDAQREIVRLKVD